MKACHTPARHISSNQVDDAKARHQRAKSPLGCLVRCTWDHTRGSLTPCLGPRDASHSRLQGHHSAARWRKSLLVETNDTVTSACMVCVAPVVETEPSKVGSGP
ncbi:hypothetical protein E2C01_024290 [Portunus trituberculatus]|uniref:Uncharacterized protein n=1 Tax=Portunus trituberculatus TaxID=210409 RepID=A0A5B7ECS0_PORTR|nr:hypothetical protein [Portunus trituberculatus]